MVLLDVLFQACSNIDGNIDNARISAYELACRHLASKGYLKKINDRLYRLIPFGSNEARL
jgi:hypothetical protein